MGMLVMRFALLRFALLSSFLSGYVCWSPSPNMNLLGQYRFLGDSSGHLNRRSLVLCPKRNSARGFLQKVEAGLFDSVFGSLKSQSSGIPATLSESTETNTWEEATDPSSGAVYYWNRETGATAWERPANIPPQTTTTPQNKVANGPGAEGKLTPMPNLYNGWFAGTYSYMGADGTTERAIAGTDEVAQQFIAAMTRALADGLVGIEVAPPPGPPTRTSDRLGSPPPLSLGPSLSQRVLRELRRGATSAEMHHIAFRRATIYAHARARTHTHTHTPSSRIVFPPQTQGRGRQKRRMSPVTPPLSSSRAMKENREAGEFVSSHVSGYAALFSSRPAPVTPLPNPPAPTDTRTHACAHKYTHARTHAHARANAQARKRARTHARTHARTRT